MFTAPSPERRYRPDHKIAFAKRKSSCPKKAFCAQIRDRASARPKYIARPLRVRRRNRNKDSLHPLRATTKDNCSRVPESADWPDSFHATASRETTFRSEEHTSELQSRGHIVCRLLLQKKNTKNKRA